MKIRLFTFLLLSCFTVIPCTFAQQYPFQNQSLPVEETVNDLVQRMTLEEKISLLSGYNDFFLHPVERLGVPAFKLADGPLGIASWGLFGRATAFPSALSVAASWNRDLAKHIGGMYAQEWRSRGIHFMLAPGVNMYRASKGARNFEYYGEDPYLTSGMVVPFIEGLQNGGVVATIKHFAANDQEYDRYTVSTEVSERALREIYFPPFEAAVKKAKVGAFMSGYNLLNGTYTSENKWLIDILKKEWNFQGLYMSDWGATHSSLEAALAGLDLEMGSNSFFISKKLIPLINEGKLSESVIDDKVRRIYRVCMEAGFFDREQQIPIPTYNEEANQAALKGAEEGTILLRNKGILPLDETRIKKIAVIGPTANPPFISDRVHTNAGIVYGGGGSSKVNPWYNITVLDGIKRRFPNTDVLYNEGISNRFKTGLFSKSKFESLDGNSGLTAIYSNADTTVQAVDRVVNFSWGRAPHQMKGADYTVKWEGYIVPEKTDDMILFVDAQGGYSLHLNGKECIDAKSSQSFHFGTTVIPAKKGEKIHLTLEYNNQRSYPAEIRMGYAYEKDIDFTEPLRLAEESDVVIFCGGLDGALELEGRDRPFDLPYGQDILIDKITAVNPNTIVVIHAGGGINMSAWADKVKGIFHALYPGMEGGNAIASLISGDINPSAKLPFTIEKRWEDSPAAGNYDETRREKKVYYNEGIFVGYRGYDKNNTEPLFPFGHGMSYTQFDYSDLQVNVKDKKSPQVEVSFTLSNTGSREGSEVIQLYVGDPVSKEPRPLRELKGFDKIQLKPGESKKVTVTLEEDAFRYFSEANEKWTFEKGEFIIEVGASSRDIRLKQSIKL